MIGKFIELGKKIYNMDNPREARRMVVFVARGCLNYGRMKKLFSYFSGNKILREIAEIYPFVYEQPTRAFFYNKSQFDERACLVEEHMDFLTTRLRPAVATGLYKREDFVLWESIHDEQPLRMVLAYEPGQRKEGLLSVMLRLGEQPLYQIIFWLAKNPQGQWSMWIGAMQGPNMENSKEVIKKITKECHAYRTKNLILYGAQAVARALGLEHIYAVTNYGYYANNHIRMDRKLKTSFSDFWQEAGGKPSADDRFYELPLTESRKTMEEVPTRKRAVYRKRFDMLDGVDQSIDAAMKRLIQKQ